MNCAFQRQLGLVAMMDPPQVQVGDGDGGHCIGPNGFYGTGQWYWLMGHSAPLNAGPSSSQLQVPPQWTRDGSFVGPDANVSHIVPSRRPFS
jgi:hypothetical protein